MKKRMIVDRPDTAKRGQYVFFDNDSTEYSGSQGLPPNADKFAEKDLYSYVDVDTFNDYIIKNDTGFPGESYIKIDKLKIKNTGTGHRMFNVYFRAWIFDQYAYEGAGGTSPVTDSYTKLYNILNSTEGKKWKFYNRNQGTVNTRSWSPNTIMSGIKLITHMNWNEPLISNHSYDVSAFDPVRAFKVQSGSLSDISDEGITNTSDNPLIKPSVYSNVQQQIYVVVWMQGDDKRSGGFGNYYTDHRRKRMQVFSLNSDQFFDNTGGNNETKIKLSYGSSAAVKEAGGGSSWSNNAAAFKCTDVDLTISTYPSSAEEEEEGSQDASLEAEILDKIQPPKSLDLNNFDESFLDQHPYREIYNIQDFYAGYNDEQKQIVKLDFDPVAQIKTISGQSDTVYDFQAYQTSSIDEQICSAPGQVSLKFDISEYLASSLGDSDLNEYGGTPDLLDYKFFVISWNDEENEFESIEDWLNSKPENFFKLTEQKQNNLYNISDITTPLISDNYQTPGIKTIKSIVFSHTNSGRIQTVRWKLVTSKIFLDIPVSQFPDFQELGGADFTVIPWPYTTPVIGGVDGDSKYKISVQDVLAGGKIGGEDVIYEKFLYQDSINDEQGQSINQFDLEQVRYFVTGSYNMNTLLNIPIESDGYYTAPYDDYEYWDCDDWDGDRNKCFSDETSVGEIFIGDNLDLFLKEDCKFELNTGNLDGKSILDTSGEGNKGLLIGDYRIKKVRKGTPMKRDSFIKIPKQDKTEGAL